MEDGKVVGQLHRGIELERQLMGIDVVGDLSAPLSQFRQSGQKGNPVPLIGSYLIVYRSVLRIELPEELREETPTGEHGALDVREECFADSFQLSKSFSRIQPRFEDLAPEGLPGRLNRCLLQYPLRPEVGEHATLAYSRFLCETTERETTESFDRSQSHGDFEKFAVRSFAV